MIAGHKPMVHLVGIGGIGMSAIARLYLALGHPVQGSDLKPGAVLEDLEKKGARIFIGHDAGHVAGAGLVVYSSSITKDHPELAAAAKKKIRTLHRAEALAELCRGKKTIAVSGTHGKTTTTSLVGVMLQEAGRDPSVAVGGLVEAFGGNARLGRGAEMVVEADESDSSFLRFSPFLEVITNIEADHLDHFGTIENIEKAYEDFIQRLPIDGCWFGCAEDERVRKLAASKLRPSMLYGFDRRFAEIYATDVVECPQSARGVSFVAWAGDERLGEVKLKILGTHNVLNALAAICVGRELDIPFERIASALSKYEGAGRRFDVRYEDAEYLVVDDYAHHPTEIKKTLAAARSLKKNRILLVFQPHRYTRTEALLNEFATSFDLADKLVLTDIYAAGERPAGGMNGETLFHAVQHSGHPQAVFVPRQRVTEYLSHEAAKGDLIITMGAGDIHQVAEELPLFLRGRRPGNPFMGIKGRVLSNEPLSRHTSLKIGGPADFWVEPEDIDDLKRVLSAAASAGTQVYLFGAGSNILASDAGLRGAAIHLGAPFFRQVHEKDGRVVAGAGVLNTLFIQYAVDHGYGGCEFLCGVPGNVGGSVAMNAGSHGQSVDAILEEVKIVRLRDGQEARLKKEEIPFGYRSSGIEGAVIVEASFRLPKKDREDTLRTLNEYREYRARTQDLQRASAGCMFKNPQSVSCSSGKLIEDAGLKGRRLGNAQVSEKHANFIVNLGDASSQDVLQLIKEVKAEVYKKFGIHLETEVKVL